MSCNVVNHSISRITTKLFQMNSIVKNFSVGYLQTFLGFKLLCKRHNYASKQDRVIELLATIQLASSYLYCSKLAIRVKTAM